MIYSPFGYNMVVKIRIKPFFFMRLGNNNLSKIGFQTLEIKIFQI